MTQKSSPTRVILTDPATNNPNSKYTIFVPPPGREKEEPPRGAIWVAAIDILDNGWIKIDHFDGMGVEFLPPHRVVSADDLSPANIRKLTVVSDAN